MMTLVLGAALACGMVTVSLAQEKKEESKKAPKKGGKKKDGEKKKQGTR
jgi:hypothetical protein